MLTVRIGFPFTLADGIINKGGFSLPDRVADGRLGPNAGHRLWYDRIKAASSFARSSSIC